MLHQRLMFELSLKGRGGGGRGAGAHTVREPQMTKSSEKYDTKENNHLSAPDE